ncbi:hypothetical protein SLEP1_g10595 [Rubroshorea leprosula]|uniref:RING-type E3 ubiquitin transferase n=1 Tax=Rubroshorea leprosula TaxID=152421 RepID=A0AAV5IEH0_9ROSI|nr:hypothetical protein SLEP1_g10595 [Rubroshorea leprosula]
MDSINNDNNGGNFPDSVDSILLRVLDFESEAEDTSRYSSLVEALSNPPLFPGISGHGNGDLNMHPGIDNLLEELTAPDTLDQDILWFLSVIGEAEFGPNNFETHQSQSLEDFLENNDVFEIEGALRGTPTSPAARFVVEGLPEVEMKGGTDRVCVICSEEIAEGKKVKILPCWHYYHGECIMPWLKMKNTCPVCRFELPTDDEIEGHLRRKRRRILEPDADNSKGNGSNGGSMKDFSVRHSFELSLMLDYEDWKQKH